MSVKKIIITFSIIALILTLSACSDYNYGMVKNTEGEPVPHAHLEINDREINTNENGYFVLKNVPPGEYTMKVDKEGYRKKSIEFEIDDKSRDRGEIVLEEK